MFEKGILKYRTYNIELGNFRDRGVMCMGGYDRTFMIDCDRSKLEMA